MVGGPWRRASQMEPPLGPMWPCWICSLSSWSCAALGKSHVWLQPGEPVRVSLPLPPFTTHWWWDCRETSRPLARWPIGWRDYFLLHKLVPVFSYLYFPCPVNSSHAFTCQWAQKSSSRKFSWFLISLKGSFLCAFFLSVWHCVCNLPLSYLLLWGRKELKSQELGIYYTLILLILGNGWSLRMIFENEKFWGWRFSAVWEAATWLWVRVIKMQIPGLHTLGLGLRKLQSKQHCSLTPVLNLRSS